MADLDRVFNHVVLPPRLPEEQDPDIPSLEHALLQRLMDAAKTLHETTNRDLHGSWTALRMSLQSTRIVNSETLDRLTLKVAFQTLLQEQNRVLVCHVVEQNAALLLHRRTDANNNDVVVFEAFEASPQSQDVLATPNALRWEFPSRAAQISIAEFDNEGFQSALASFLDKASSEQLSHLAAKATKAGVSFSEIRNPGSPALITHMLITVIEAMGSLSDVERLNKRVRDDVHFKKGQIPWRRLPFWLILRVAAQRQLHLALGPITGRVAYKALLAAVLARLLDDCVESRMDPSQIILLKKKLCRRLAKLQDPKTRNHGGTYQLLRATESMFQRSIENADRHVQAVFDHFKASVIRKIPLLPVRINEAADELRLSLPSSQSYLRQLQSSQRAATWAAPEYTAKTNYDCSLVDRSEDSGIRKVQQFYQKCKSVEMALDLAKREVVSFWKKEALDLAKREVVSFWKQQALAEDYSRHAAVKDCLKLSEVLETLMSDISTLGDSNPEHCSAFLLSIFDLWAAMDAAALFACPLLVDYCPAFQSELLDVLHVPSLEEMERLREIQGYLYERQKVSKYQDKTIFGPLGGHCFGADFTTRSKELRALRESIHDLQEKNRRRKTEEWKEECEEYDKFSAKILSNACRCTIFPDGRRDVRGCTRCYFWRLRKRMAISVCEDLLPIDPFNADAVVFDLAMPEVFATYRNTTWKVLTKFAHPTRPATASKAWTLSEHKELMGFSTSGLSKPTITLASPVKSVSQTHYNKQPMKADLNRLLLPLASKFELYDSESKTWVGHYAKPLTLAHWCGIHVPGDLSSTVLPRLSHPPMQPDGPSSYTAVSNRTKCPAGMSVHEFEAYQRLLSGKERRWLTLLVELGSSNLNFSKVDTMLMLSHLANQAGPMISPSDAKGTTRDTTLGVCHAPFSDMGFVQRLIDEIGKRIRMIRGNWHEINMMELLLTLSLRTYVLVRDVEKRQKALNLIRLAREAILDWLDTLQNEVAHAKEGGVAHNASMYAFKAALLCRRTLVAFGADGQKPLSPDDISSYVRGSVALQHNFVVDLETLSGVDKAMLQRDCSMATLLQDKIRTAISSNPDIMTTAIAHGVGMIGKEETITVGTEETSADLKYRPWEFLPSPNEGWVSSAFSRGPASRFQRIDFHYVEGHILVDGRTVAKLPQDIRDSEDVKELFEHQHLLTLPSWLPGMTHCLTRHYRGHYVHFGRRNKRVVISTTKYGEQWEFVPRRIFIDERNTYDLPRSLVDNCVHWYNKQNRTVEFRRKDDIWFTRSKFWSFDITNQQLRKSKSTLVDPHSQICRKIATIFHRFADPQRLTVFRSLRSQLSVELPHLDLSFVVNNNGLLQCKELSSEIDPNQDAGTLYGYESMIVLRDVYDRTRRSLIAPLGRLCWKCTGPHVSVHTDIGELPRGRGVGPRAAHSADSTYARFGIDTILRRLTCPPELLLLYTKARLHAVTSFPLVDPLTGRTGDEEAVQILTSSRCQPWVPLGNGPAEILKQLELLSPTRLYYPKEMRILQQVAWDATLPTCVQHDHYGRLIQDLFAKSKNLSHFNETAVPDESTNKTDVEDDSSSTLGMRGEIQRLRYESPQTGSLLSLKTENNDRKYTSLGCIAGPFPNAEKNEAFNTSSVFQITRMLREEAREVPMAQPMSKLMSNWNLMGGFDSALETDMVTLSTLTSTLTMGDRWGPLVELCRRATSSNAAEVMFTLAIIAFSPGIDMDYVHLLAAYSYLPKLKASMPPQHVSYDRFRFEEKPTAKTLEEIISSCYREYKASNVGSVGWSSALAKHRQECAQYQAGCQKEGTEMARRILQQWPHYSEPSAMGFSSDQIDVSTALAKIRTEWKRLVQNKDLTDYVREVQNALLPHRTIRKHKPRLTEAAETAVTCGGLVAARLTVVPSLSQHLLQMDMPPLQERCPDYEAVLDERPAAPRSRIDLMFAKPLQTELQSDLQELGQIVSSFTKSASPLRQDYGRDLAESMKALARVAGKTPERKTSKDEILPREAEIDGYIRYATSWCNTVLGHICGHFSIGAKASRLLQQAGLWPRLTPVSILELLRATAEYQYGANVRETLITYGCAVTALQRLHRVRRILKNDLHRASEEWRNRGHQNWSPTEQADWLLFEIDSDLLIRAEQVEVARAIIAPASGKNSVLQLNMGKGKTSCIVPMAIASLANGKQLARLVVPKALLLPTAQMLQSRLGGLVGRELRHVPFSRRIATGANVKTVLQVFKEHHNDLMQRRGVLLAAPEHILAFKLSGLQCLADGKNTIAREMIEFQQKLTDKMCRDILDESDFTLAVRTQLVYPSGTLSAVDAAPHRWKLAQTLLAIVEENLPRLCQEFGNSIRAVQRPFGGFPMIYILRTDIGEELCRCVVNDISSGRVPFFRPTPSSSRTKKRGRQHTSVAPDEAARLLRKALSRGADNTDVDRAAEMFADTRSVADGLTLIRGLLLDNILLVCLKKRWNVQYGLHPQRWPIAVPFEAKGVPSERSEFGHPDVAILLTCLAFYYNGLNRSQFCDGLKHVLQHTDDPASEYERWTAGAKGLPDELQHWNMINVDDAAQVQKLGEYLCWTRPVIDHYLNTFVFPLHSRQFSVKLQGSAWDLPLFRAGTATTGFSGTNDNKMMLPLTITQEDLPSLRQTNAEVLTYLLKPRNRSYRCMAEGMQRWAEEDLLASLVKERIHVLIDAGAYILEKDNESLARAWLERQRKETDFKAAVFFSADNRAWVLSAAAEKMPLLASPFVDQLDKCLVYFDEAHTRGVDLLLPPESRGALTLALGQTKDHTVQAAMRLRQLGTTQSVVFYAPPEVDESIREVCRSRLEGPLRAAGSLGRITSPHVICWLLEQTCLANEQLHPLYLSHGYDFCRRASSQWKYGSRLAEDRSRAALVDVLQQPERQTVAQLYGNSQDVSSTTKATKTAQKLALPELEAFSMQLQSQKRQDGAVMGVAGGAWKTQAPTTGAFEEVEQEREVEAQVEQVRAQQRRVQFDALTFPGQVHRNIRAFVQTGILGGDRGYKPAFASLAQTELGSRYGVQAQWPTRLFVSDEFDRTIVVEGGRGADDFLRPVEWTIWSPTTETALVVVPEELELLLPTIRSRESRVHLLAYAAPITRPMATTFSGLQYLVLPALPLGYRLPAWLPVELGILAGRLYMTLDEAVAMAEYLGGSTKDDAVAAANGSLFCADPTSFLLEWLSLRRVGQDIMHTPAAYVCQGRVIRPDHAFFAGVGNCGRGSRLSTSSGDSGRTSNTDLALFSEGGEGSSDSSESEERKGGVKGEYGVHGYRDMSI